MGLIRLRTITIQGKKIMKVGNFNMVVGNGQEFKMTTIEIAEQTGKRHDNVLADTRKMIVELYGESSLLSFQESFIATNGKSYHCYALPKRDVLTLVSGYSIALRSKIINRLEELENKKPVNNFQLPETIQCQLMGAETIARMLNYSDTSKINIVSRVYKANNLSSSFLPEYVENAKVIFSATELLRRTGAEIGIRQFNKLLLSAGYLEEKTRPSSKGTSKFKALTDKGLKYGQNDVSPHSELQVQPHFFENSFTELYSEVTK